MDKRVLKFILTYGPITAFVAIGTYTCVDLGRVNQQFQDHETVGFASAQVVLIDVSGGRPFAYYSAGAYTRREGVSTDFGWIDIANRKCTFSL